MIRRITPWLLLFAVASVVAALSGRAQQPAAPSQPTTAQAADWQIPDPDKLPDDAFGRTVRYGRDLIAKTSTLIGPDAPDPAMRFSGNGLDCGSCHLLNGTKQFGLPLAGVWGVFPQYIARENEVRTLEERINGCMERSMNGRLLPVGGREMKAMLSYMRFISAPEQVGESLKGRSTPTLPLPQQAADVQRGRVVFGTICAACHGAGGQGMRTAPADAKATGMRYQYPPLWGPDSYNDGAGMARPITAAQFIRANMPFGISFAAPALSVADAFDVAAFIDSQPRPHKVGLDADFPDRSRKPVDATYPPFLGPFTAEQHHVGPWGPMQEWMKANAAALKAMK